MLEDLLTVAPPERRPPLEAQLELLESMVRRSFEDERDIAAGLTPDRQGIGSTPEGRPDPARDSLRRPSGRAAEGEHARR
jgi:hypothetical protein